MFASPDGCASVYSVPADLADAARVPGFWMLRMSPLRKEAKSVSRATSRATWTLERSVGRASFAQISGMNGAACVVSIVLAPGVLPQV